MSIPPTLPPEHDDALAPRSNAERQWLERSAGQLRADRDALDVSGNWARIEQHIRQASAKPASPVSRTRRGLGITLLASWFRRWRQAAAGFALGAAAAAAVAWTLLPVLPVFAPPTHSALQPLGASAPSPANAVLLQVVFRDQASVAQMRAALQAAGASVRSGPSSLGIWSVEVPSDRARAALAALQASAAVEHVAQQP